MSAHINDTSAGRCTAALVVKGESFRCDLAVEHGGWVHSNRPAEAIWNGGEPPATAADRPSVTDNALAEAWAEGHRTGWEHCQDGNYGNDHWDDPTPNPYAAADRPSVTDNARAVREAAMDLYRALRRTNPDAWAEVDEVEDWTYWDDIVRTVQVTLAAARAETTTATDEDTALAAEEAIEEALYANDLVRSGGIDGDQYIVDGLLGDVVRALAGLLATPRGRGRAETTTATTEDAARVLDDVIQHLRKIWSTGHDEAREVIDTAEELLAQALPRLGATARAATTTATTEDMFEQAWEVIARVRDAYPRTVDDAPTEDIVDALIDARLLVTARTHPTTEDALDSLPYFTFEDDDVAPDEEFVRKADVARLLATAHTATTKDAALVIHEAHCVEDEHGDHCIFWEEDHQSAQALADAGLLTTADTHPTREQIDRAVGEVLSNASNHPDPVSVLGRSIAPLRTKITDAVLELLRDGAR